MIGGFNVGDGHKSFDPGGFGISDREKLLVFAHRGLQHFWRQAQKRRINPAQQNHWPFDQPCHFGQQPGVWHQFQSGGKGGILGGLQDGSLALCRVQHNESAFQFGGIIVKAVHRNHTGGHETVAARGVARRDTIDGQRNHGAARLIRQLAQNRMQRAHPAQGTIAPAHGFGPWESADRVFQHFGNDQGCGTSGLFDDGVKRFALFVGAAV